MRFIVLLLGLLLLMLACSAETPPAREREALCQEAWALRYDADPDPILKTRDARRFLRSLEDAELELFHEFTASHLRYTRDNLDLAADAIVWSVMGIAELDCGGAEFGQSVFHATPTP